MNVNEKYFLGGYDPNHPNQNVQFRLVDNLDGTGTFYEYDEEGNVLYEEDRDDLDIPEDTTGPDPEAIVGMLAQLSPEDFQRVLLLGIAITNPESVFALEYAVVTEDPLVGIEVVRDAALTALNMTEEEAQNG